MAGAIRMAGEAALRSGAGLVRVLTHIEHIAPLLTSCPEMMVQALTKASLEAALDWADVIVIGPGLGQTAWARQAVQQLQRFDKPMLWDADALNLLAQSPSVNQHRILTPHPGEAARLLNCSVAEIELDRMKAVNKLQQKYGGVVVLKGAGTLIACEKRYPSRTWGILEWEPAGWETFCLVLSAVCWHKSFRCMMLPVQDVWYTVRLLMKLRKSLVSEAC